MSKKEKKSKPSKASGRQQPRADYEAGKPSRLRKTHRDRLSPNDLVGSRSASIRAQVRNLERNHDITRGAIRTLVNNIIGPSGISIEPQPRKRDGSIHTEYATALREAWRDWCKRPEVTWRMNWAAAQRMMARVWIRDGEAFAQELLGAVNALDHGTRVPYSLELFEPDMIPLDYNDESKGIRQGMQVNAWGRITGAWVYKTHPLDSGRLISNSDLKFIPADRLIHIFRCDRLHQLRGVSEFASVINRLQDVSEYESAEQIAAKLAANLTLYIKRGSPEHYDPNSDDRPTDAQGRREPREIEFEPGTIIDGLGLGEEIGLIDSKRPNPNAITWRMGQLRAVAAGVGASYSSLARDYDGTYSAQRQELVEQFVNYAVLTDEFTSMNVQPVWERFVSMAHLSGAVKRPADVDPDKADDALYIGQSMPWIDPVKEATAWLTLVRAGFASEVEVMRRRGVNPMDVLEQVAQWRNLCAQKGLRFDSDASMQQAVAAALNAGVQPDQSQPQPGARTRTRSRKT